MYLFASSIKYHLGGICTAKLNLLSKQQRSILVFRLLGQTDLIFSGNRYSLGRDTESVPHLTVFLRHYCHSIFCVYGVSVLSLVHRASRKAAVTLDSTFLFKMASNNQETLLTAEQLIKYKTNYQVRKLEQNNPRNHTGKDLLIYCDNDYGRLNTGSILVCLWNDHSHKIARPNP